MRVNNTLPCTLPHIADRTAAHCRTAAHTLPRTAAHCRTATQSILVLFRFVYYHNTHQVLVRLPQGVDGLPILFHFISFEFIFTTRSWCS
jgi:hypothetical protein